LEPKHFIIIIIFSFLIKDKEFFALRHPRFSSCSLSSVNIFLQNHTRHSIFRAKSFSVDFSRGKISSVRFKPPRPQDTERDVRGVVSFVAHPQATLRRSWGAVAATDASMKFNQNQRDKMYRSVKANAPGWLRWIPCGRKTFRSAIDQSGDLIIGGEFRLGPSGDESWGLLPHVAAYRSRQVYRIRIRRS